MPIPVTFFTLARNSRIFAFKPESVSFGDGEGLDLKVNQNRVITPISLKMKQVTLKLEGAVGAILQDFLDERENNIVSLLNGNPIGVDMNFFGYVIYKAYLKEVVPSGCLEVGGITLYQNIDLIFQSQVYV